MYLYNNQVHRIIQFREFHMISQKYYWQYIFQIQMNFMHVKKIRLSKKKFLEFSLSPLIYKNFSLSFLKNDTFSRFSRVTLNPNEFCSTIKDFSFFDWLLKLGCSFTTLFDICISSFLIFIFYC